MADRYLEFNRAIRHLSQQAQNDLTVAFANGNADYAMLREIIPKLVEQYGLAAGSMAAAWYDDLRDAYGVAKRFTAIVPEVGEVGTDSLIGWAADHAEDYTSMRALIAGGIQRRIANMSREAIIGSSHADPGARGWMRTGSGECEFCAMLIGRGAVYSQSSVKFKSHDWCNCGASPAFDPSQVHEIKRQFVPSARHRSANFTKDNRRRVKAYLNANDDAG